MKFSKEQLQTLKESTTTKVKRPRIKVSHWEKVNITVSQKSCEPYTYVFGIKTYINRFEMEHYKGFTIYFE